MKRAMSLAGIYAPCYAEWQCLYPAADKPNQISPRFLQINSHKVNVNALKTVVRRTTPEEKEPS